MAPIRVVVHGAAGRMGREVLAALSREKDMEPVGGVDIKPLGESIPLPDGSRTIPYATSLEGMLSQVGAQVVVDFTNAEACMAAVPVAAKYGANLVIGTSGLSEANLTEIDRIARESGIGAFLAPNFALGAVLMQHLARIAAPFFDYVEIVEMHHEAKIDAPSGTALALARAIAQGRSFQRNIPQKEPLPGTRGGDYQGVTIHSVRMPGRLAHHEVTFGTSGQTLSIRHDTISRECYMPGVLKAIREVANFKGLVVGLEKILGL
jgi:4-hydroxy-tetrahydrodipicolinate reductase